MTLAAFLHGVQTATAVGFVSLLPLAGIATIVASAIDCWRWRVWTFPNRSSEKGPGALKRRAELGNDTAPIGRIRTLGDRP